jgi:hypothetical protein
VKEGDPILGSSTIRAPLHELLESSYRGRRDWQGMWYACDIMAFVVLTENVEETGNLVDLGVTG